MNAVLVIIDPLMAYLASKTKANYDQDVRGALAPLAAMAERTGAAVVLVRHLNKNAFETKALYRGGGSIGIIGAVRAGHLVAAHPENRKRRVFAATKSNLAKETFALEYEVESVNIPAEAGEIEAPKIHWLGRSALTDTDLLKTSDSQARRPKSDLTVAEEFLLDVLANGPSLQAEVLAQASTAGIAKRTLYRAKDKLGIKPQKSNDEDGKWYWELPKQPMEMKPGTLPN